MKKTNYLIHLSLLSIISIMCISYWYWSWSCSQYWPMAIESDYWFCVCKKWYTLWNNKSWEKECIEWNQHCNFIYWTGSFYDLNSNSCKCNDWYSLKMRSNSDEICEKNSNSVLFFLVEYDDERKLAIVKSREDHKRYLLKLKPVNWLNKAKDFIYDSVYIDLWNDNKINVNDKFNLKNLLIRTDITSDILAIKVVGKTFMLWSCEEYYGVNSIKTKDNYCTCKDWYKWSTLKDHCESIDAEDDIYLKTASKMLKNLNNKISKMSKEQKIKYYDLVLDKLMEIYEEKANNEWTKEIINNLYLLIIDAKDELFDN